MKKGIVIFIIIILFVLAMGYVFLFSPFFKIKTIEASGNKEIKTEEIRENFNYDNIFLYSEESINNDLLRRFPKISELEVKKNFLKRVVELTIKERERFGIICRMGLVEEDGKENIKNCFYIDKKGFAFEEALETSGSLILLIKDYSQKDFNLGEQVFKEDIVSFTSQIKENLFIETDIKIKDLIISSFPYTDLRVLTSEGWFIVFNLQREARGQILTLKAALEDGIDQEKREDLEYIDLRIENRVYYK